MPANANDPNPFGDGDLNQELIDQMLNGGAVEQDPWSDETLQAEIEAARLTAGVTGDFGPSSSASTPTPIAAAVDRAPSQGRVPTAVHPVQFMPLAPELPPLNDRANGIELLMDVALEV